MTGLQKKRAGGAAAVVVLLVAVWYLTARGKTPAEVTSTPVGSKATATPVSSDWHRLTRADAKRGQSAVQSLGRRSGPVFANLTPAEAASYIFTVVAKQLPPSAKNAEAAIIGDRLYVRADVETKDFGGSKALGPIGMLLGARDSVRFGGTVKVLRPGLAEFVVQEVKIGRIDLPSPLIPRVLTRMKRGKPVKGVSANGLPIVMPAYITDLRIAKRRITLYKSVK